MLGFRFSLCTVVLGAISICIGSFPEWHEVLRLWPLKLYKTKRLSGFRTSLCTVCLGAISICIGSFTEWHELVGRWSLKLYRTKEQFEFNDGSLYVWLLSYHGLHTTIKCSKHACIHSFEYIYIVTLYICINLKIDKYIYIFLPICLWQCSMMSQHLVNINSQLHLAGAIVLIVALFNSVQSSSHKCHVKCHMSWEISIFDSDADVIFLAVFRCHTCVIVSENQLLMA